MRSVRFQIFPGFLAIAENFRCFWWEGLGFVCCPDFLKACVTNPTGVGNREWSYGTFICDVELMVGVVQWLKIMLASNCRFDSGDGVWREITLITLIESCDDRLEMVLFTVKMTNQSICCLPSELSYWMFFNSIPKASMGFPVKKRLEDKGIESYDLIVSSLVCVLSTALLCITICMSSNNLRREQTFRCYVVGVTWRPPEQLARPGASRSFSPASC